MGRELRLFLCHMIREFEAIPVIFRLKCLKHMKELSEDEDFNYEGN